MGLDIQPTPPNQPSENVVANSREFLGKMSKLETDAITSDLQKGLTSDITKNEMAKIQEFLEANKNNPDKDVQALCKKYSQYFHELMERSSNNKEMSEADKKQSELITEYHNKRYRGTDLLGKIQDFFGRNYKDVEKDLAENHGKTTAIYYTDFLEGNGPKGGHLRQRTLYDITND